MPTIRELKEDLHFNASLIELMEIMKNTAIFQFRALQAKRERFELFLKAITSFFSLIGTRSRSSILVNPVSKRSAVIIITSDEGFVGGLNTQVMNAAFLHEGAEEAEIVVVGERGARYLKETGKSFVPFKGAATSQERQDLAAGLADYIIKGVKEEKFGKVAVAYPVPVSFMLQRAEVVNILPLVSESGDGAVPKDKRELIIESPLDDIINYLAEELIKKKLSDILEDSKLSEFAARSIHLEGSSQELTENNKKVKLQYFKAHHEVIDKSTRELFAAQVTIRAK